MDSQILQTKYIFVKSQVNTPEYIVSRTNSCRFPQYAVWPVFITLRQSRRVTKTNDTSTIPDRKTFPMGSSLRHCREERFLFPTWACDV